MNNLLVSKKKIFICCPKINSGGPENLHQLTDELRNQGFNASICYYPFHIPHQSSSRYDIYNSPQGIIEDASSSIIIIPETATYLAWQFKKAQIFIFWLSVDNYFINLLEFPFRQILSRHKPFIKIPKRLASMRNYSHLTQSYYASQFLLSNLLRPQLLGDYLNEKHIINRQDGSASHRADIIVYNPLKGIKQTDALIKAYPDFKFVPICKMTESEVARLLGTAKIYIDFGHHPGKDRLPREAAMAGCCVITCRRGAAQYFEDIPIGDNYKLDDQSDGYIVKFGELAREIFNDYESHTLDFSQYRKIIRNEKSLFKKNVQEVFHAFRNDMNS